MPAGKINGMSYCNAIKRMSEERRALHQAYHDDGYGMPLDDDDELFGRLILEINQAGLSWETILKKQAAFRKAYDGFSVEKVAAYAAQDRKRLMNDAGIIRNRLKIDAAIENAKAILALQKEYGSFQKWLESHHPMSRKGWVKLFKETFRFTGGEIVNEFLMSIGYIRGAHSPGCALYGKILTKKPMWARG